MNGQHAPHASPQPAAAFTLVEIVLALAIIATAFVAILGLLPAGLDASRQAANSTVVAAVLDDVHQRLQNQPLTAGPVAFSPVFYDDRGIYIAPDADPATQARRLYRADISIVNWTQQPANTSALRPVTIALSWPVNPPSGEAIGKENPRTFVTYGATTLTGPDWQAIDPRYTPKVGF
jgi:uncharacterized protein (TIGR02598 family)